MRRKRKCGSYDAHFEQRENAILHWMQLLISFHFSESNFDSETHTHTATECSKMQRILQSARLQNFYVQWKNCFLHAPQHSILLHQNGVNYIIVESMDSSLLFPPADTDFSKFVTCNGLFAKLCTTVSIDFVVRREQMCVFISHRMLMLWRVLSLRRCVHTVVTLHVWCVCVMWCRICAFFSTSLPHTHIHNQSACLFPKPLRKLSVNYFRFSANASGGWVSECKGCTKLPSVIWLLT